MNNSNLEFRKIKSLQFLYEINSNGTILRNVKSKKQLKIKIDYHHSLKGYYCSFCRIKGQCKRLMIHKLVAECWLGDKPEGLQVDHIDRNSLNNDYRNLRYVTHSEQMKNRVLSNRILKQATANCMAWVKTISKPVKVNSQLFESMTAAAKYIASLTGSTSESIRGRLKKRRKEILGFNIEYECRD